MTELRPRTSLTARMTVPRDMKDVAAVVVPCRMSIDLAGLVVPGPVEVGTEAGRPDS